MQRALHSDSCKELDFDHKFINHMLLINTLDYSIIKYIKLPFCSSQKPRNVSSNPEKSSKGYFVEIYLIKLKKYIHNEALGL